MVIVKLASFIFNYLFLLMFLVQYYFCLNLLLIFCVLFKLKKKLSAQNDFDYFLCIFWFRVDKHYWIDNVSSILFINGCSSPSRVYICLPTF